MLSVGTHSAQSNQSGLPVPVIAGVVVAIVVVAAIIVVVVVIFIRRRLRLVKTRNLPKVFNKKALRAFIIIYITNNTKGHIPLSEYPRNDAALCEKYQFYRVAVALRFVASYAVNPAKFVQTSYGQKLQPHFCR